MKRQGAWEEYKSCFIQDGGIDLVEFLNGCRSLEHIDSAFIWDNGGCYSYSDWSDLDARWRDYLEAN